jgi:energy-coupling factor transporter ATP-binding protein EcfA2
MPETPRSSKRRRLNHSPELASTERSTRRSAKSTEDELYHVIEVTESPVYEVDSPRRSATKKATPLRQYTRKNLQAQKVPAASNPSTPTKSQAKSQRPPRSGLMSQGKTPARSTRRQRVGETVGGEEDELALPVEHELDELNVDPLGTELEDSRFGRGLRGPRIENATTDGNRVNGTPSKARKRLTPRKPVKEGAQESVDSEGDAMDVDNDLAGRSRGTNGIHATINGTSSPKPSTTTQSSSEQQSTLKNIVLSKLSQRRPIPLKNLDTEYTKVHQLLHATVTAGESNSLLLIGARGSGKTAIVNAVLRDLSRSQKEHFHTIRLNGFIQTDDKLALREIWRQLGREMEISDAEDGGGKSYADTLTMLLALLSHPDEIAATATDGSSVARSVIFIMDEFDLFATHARQTLLYNLLDIAQSRKAPIAVIGLTARIDVTEALEKRVKSRFSHRYVHLSLPKTLSEFVNVGKAALRVDAEDLTFEEKAVLLGGEAGTALVGSKKKARTNSFGSIVEEWNNAIEVSEILFAHHTFSAL